MLFTPELQWQPRGTRRVTGVHGNRWAAQEWRPLVERAGALLGQPFTWGQCDLRGGLHSPPNRRLLQLAPTADVFLFSYVLHEVGQGAWEAAVRQLYGAAAVGR